jgi:hypothetical protein|tara:strand:+ start:6725 stop:9307 length:2583 start_codon:yes stop_codon:yes gene_type:complete
MNIIGRPFSKVVTDQIEARQDSLAKGIGNSPSDLLYQQSKTPWIRLASAVDINDVDKVNDLSSLGFNKQELEGQNLAENFILQGGAISLKPDQNQNDAVNEGSTGDFQSGLNFGTNFKGAYGWGGTSERGLVPMPGITSASVKYINNGALTKTTINIKCFSRNQLALIDLLYMRPGYTVLLEFGWSVYLDSNQTPPVLEAYDSFKSPALRYLFNDPTDQYKLLKNIRDEQDRTCGNYGAVYGKISNFNWKFNPDGSYDCIVTLVGMGELIESLKINTFNLENAGSEGSKEDDDEEKEIPLISQASKSSLNLWLYSIYQGEKGWLGGNSGYEGNFIDRDFKDFCLINDDGSTKTGQTLKIKNAEFHCEINNSDRGDDNDEQVQIYITFGYLLAWLQKNVLLNNKNIPCCAFDFDFKDLHRDLNLFNFPKGNFSSDPSCCIVPFEQPSLNKSDLTAAQTAELIASTSEGFSAFLKKALKNITGWGVQLKFGGYDKNVFGVVNEKHMKYGGTAADPGGFKWDDNLARMSQILININHIAQVLEECPIDNDNAKSLNRFLQKLIANINKSTGGINDIVVELSDDQSKIVFRNKTPQRYKDRPPPDIPGKIEKICTFNTFGKGSAIKNLSIDASISKEFSAMVTIGAQKNGNQTAGNAASFSNYNEGLVDRVMPAKTSGGSQDGKDDTDQKIEVAQIIRIAQMINVMNTSAGITDAISGGAGGLWDQIMDDLNWYSEDINSFNANHTQYIQALQGYYAQPKPSDGGKSPQGPSPFFLPFNFSIDIDGITGMKIFEKFKVDNKVLPLTYSNSKVDIVIKSVDHEINLSSWTTKIGTLSTPTYDPPLPSTPQSELNLNESLGEGPLT